MNKRPYAKFQEVIFVLTGRAFSQFFFKVLVLTKFLIGGIYTHFVHARETARY